MNMVSFYIFDLIFPLVTETYNNATLIIIQGVANGMMAPTLPDLRNRLQVDYQDIALGLASLNVGIISGGFVGGLFLDRVKNEGLLLALSSLFAAAAICSLPLSPNLIAAMAFFFCFGFCVGFTETGK